MNDGQPTGDTYTTLWLTSMSFFNVIVFTFEKRAESNRYFLCDVVRNDVYFWPGPFLMHRSSRRASKTH